MSASWAIVTEELTRTFTKTWRRPWWKRWRTPSRGAVSAPRAAPETFVALDRINLQVRQGELFGLLGPNGAGKTTLIKILATLLAPTSGRAWVDGRDVVTQAEAIRPYINMVSGGESSGYGILTVRENLWLFARLYGVPSRLAYERIDQMLRIVGLEDKAQTRISHLSTGQRQKMNFCRGFITDPTILFLDEPTLGLDVRTARTIRTFIRRWLEEKPGRTILLTTHYMAEAEELCDRLAIIDHGRLLACDTPAALKRQVQQYPRYVIHLAPSTDGWSRLSQLPGVHSVQVHTTPTSTDVKLSLREDAVIGSVVQTLVQHGGHILSLQKQEPTLEDVFLELVGRQLNGPEENEPEEELRASSRLPHYRD
jgi:ABC-2 type transport system ATP-binding protein